MIYEDETFNLKIYNDVTFKSMICKNEASRAYDSWKWHLEKDNAFWKAFVQINLKVLV